MTIKRIGSGSKLTNSSVIQNNKLTAGIRKSNYCLTFLYTLIGMSAFMFFSFIYLQLSIVESAEIPFASLLSSFFGNSSLSNKSHSNKNNKIHDIDDHDPREVLRRVVISPHYSRSLVNFAQHWHPRSSSTSPYQQDATIQFTKMSTDVATSTTVWGSYRPDIYFGMKTISHPSSSSSQTLSTGIVWTSVDEMNGNRIAYNRNSYRHKTSQDELQTFEWILHDGKEYGQQILLDPLYNMAINTTFLVFNGENDISRQLQLYDKEESIIQTSNLKWLQRISIANIKNSKSQPRRSPTSGSSKVLLFYFGADEWISDDGDDGDRSIKDFEIIVPPPSPSSSQSSVLDTVLIKGYTKMTGWFRLECRLFVSNAHLKSSSISPSMKATLSHVNSVSDGVTNMIDDHKRGILGGTLQQQQQQSNSNNNFITVELSISDANSNDSNNNARYTLEVLFYDHQQESSLSPTSITATITTTSLSSDVITSWLQQKTVDFNQRFDKTYQLNENKHSTTAKTNTLPTYKFNDIDVDIGRRALSSLLGGVGYFVGHSEVADGIDIDTTGAVVTSDVAEMKRLRQAHATAATAANKTNKNKATKRQLQQQREMLTLLCTTPSRTSFPRGFLWDEGFHQLVVVQWDMLLTMKMLSSWLGNLHYYSPSNTKTKDTTTTASQSQSSLGGWLPREMILGADASARVPSEFIPQRVNIANPPTFFLVMEVLLNKYEKFIKESQDMLLVSSSSTSCVNENSKSNNQHTSSPQSSSSRESCQQAADNNNNKTNDTNTTATLNQGIEALETFFHSITTPLNDWIYWFLLSQSGPHTVSGSFRWRGRVMQDNKLIANTLASGLDDFPRAPVPSSQEYHLDLLCWMIKATQIMGRLQLQQQFQEEDRVKIGESCESKSSDGDHRSSSSSTPSQQQFSLNYTHLSTQLLSRLTELHWSAEHHAYFDVGLDDSQGGLLQETVLRCQSTSTTPAKQQNSGVTRRGSGGGEIVDVTVPLTFNKQPIQHQSNSNSNHCPESHPELLFHHADENGQPLLRDRYYYEPKNLKLQFIPRIGYSTLYPLLLQLLSPTTHSSTSNNNNNNNTDSVDVNHQFAALLDIMEDQENGLWSAYGLRSMAAADMFYWKDNAPGDRPYWRGPIWINMNYLALKALHYYAYRYTTATAVASDPNNSNPDNNMRSNGDGTSSSTSSSPSLQQIQLRCGDIYIKLRQNILQLVLSEHLRTGHFWEQYDDRTGKGMRGHPFTGWTALIVNIMSEKYHE